MIRMGRLLTAHELELRDKYEAALDTVPNSRRYDRVSIHNAFPHIKKAFDEYCELTQKTNDYLKIMEILSGEVSSDD